MRRGRGGGSGDKQTDRHTAAHCAAHWRSGVVVDWWLLLLSLGERSLGEWGFCALKRVRVAEAVGVPLGEECSHRRPGPAYLRPGMAASGIAGRDEPVHRKPCWWSRSWRGHRGDGERGQCVAPQER
jgi:hypothetical protein